MPNARGNGRVGCLTLLNARLYVERTAANGAPCFVVARLGTRSAVALEVGAKTAFCRRRRKRFKKRTYRRQFCGLVPRFDVKVESERRRALKKTNRSRSGGRKTVARQELCERRQLTIPIVLKLSLGSVGDAHVCRGVRRSLDVKRFKSEFVLMNRACEGDETRQTARDVGLNPIVWPKRYRRKP